MDEALQALLIKGSLRIGAPWRVRCGQAPVQALQADAGGAPWFIAFRQGGFRGPLPGRLPGLAAHAHVPAPRRAAPLRGVPHIHLWRSCHLLRSLRSWRHLRRQHWPHSCAAQPAGLRPCVQRGRATILTLACTYCTDVQLVHVKMSYRCTLAEGASGSSGGGYQN